MDEKCIKLITIVAILSVTGIVIGGIICVNIRSKRAWGGYSTKLVGVTFIVAMALIAYVYDTCTNSPIYALLGTLAGYFLGHGKGEKNKSAE